MSDDGPGGALVVLALFIGVAVATGAELPALPALGSGSSGGGSGSDRVCVADVRGFDREQERNASTIARVAHDMDMPDEAIVVALATAMQESGLRNLDYGDRDSLGLFQQRPSQGWGTPRQVRDPEYAARKFYSKLRQVDGWENMRVTEAAQAVQISAFPEAYAQHEGDARRLARALHRCR